MDDNNNDQKIRRRIYVVDRDFQLKYTALIVGVGMGISIILGFFLYRAHVENTELLNIGQVMAAEVAKYDTRVLYYIVAFIIAMGVALTIYGVLVTHRIAGPLLVISRHLNSIARGQYPDVRPLRKHDELKDFFDIFNSMLNSLRDKDREDISDIEQVIEAIDNQKGEDGVEVLIKMKSRKAKLLEQLM